MHQSLPTGIALAAVIALATAGCGGSDRSHSSSKESTSSASAASSANRVVGDDDGVRGTGRRQRRLQLLADQGQRHRPGGHRRRAADRQPRRYDRYGSDIQDHRWQPDHRRQIAVFPDAAAAAGMIQPMKDAITDKVDGQQKPVDIGSNGFMVEGPGEEEVDGGLRGRLHRGPSPGRLGVRQRSW